MSKISLKPKERPKYPKNYRNTPETNKMIKLPQNLKYDKYIPKASKITKIL